MINIYRFFSDHKDQYLKFDRVTEKLSNRSDLNAFLILDRLCTGDLPIISEVDNDQIYFDVNPPDIEDVATEEDLLNLIRCGVFIDKEYGPFTITV